MAGKKKKSLKEKKKSKQSIFRQYGKYFLILFLVLGQAVVAYSVVDKNYDAIYSYAQSLIPENSGKIDMDEIIINPADTNGQRYLLVQFSVELDDMDDQELFEEHRSEVRNNIIKYLSGKTVSELQGIQDKEDLRVELIQLINSTMDSRSVRNLYYSKYVMQ